jgi:cyclohexyl-isocyanide hydratase
MTIDIVFLAYPGMALLDLAGPIEVLQNVPDARVHLVWKNRQAVTSDGGTSVLPTATFATLATFADLNAADVLCVPGGAGQLELMEDQETIRWVRAVGKKARFVTSVCTGAFVLGAAGLLEGYRATTHWASLPLLEAYGATPVEERVVVDRNRLTGAGVTAGIDLALRLASVVASQTAAEAIELALEYDPAPPFKAGHPRIASPRVVDLVRARFADRIERRTRQASQFASARP